MPYVKPGVEVKQVQKTATPILNSPELTATIVGRGYWWQDPTWEDEANPNRNSVYSGIYDNGSTLTIPYSAINSEYNVLSNKDCYAIDLVVSEGAGTGTVVHLTSGMVQSNTTSQIVLKASILSDLGLGTKAQVKVGFLAKNDSKAKTHLTYSSISDIQDGIGEPMSFNPLAFGAKLAMNNAGASVGVVSTDGDADADFVEALDVLETVDTYVIAPMSHKMVDATYATHVTAQSTPTQKRERIVFLNPELSFAGGGSRYSQDSSQKSTDAATMRDANASIGNKRVFNVFPDAGYVEETRHISTIRPDWVRRSLTDHTSVFDSVGNFCKFAADTTVGTETYKAGVEITDAIWVKLNDGGYGGASGLVTVLAPVPGFYYGAANAGLVIGKAPEAPLTNVAIGGIKETRGSADYYSEAQLNTIGEGGTYIMTQSNPIAPIVSRHQMSTDVTSIAKRELSITTALDYTAKFLRKALKPYIGKNVISPAFLKLANTVLVGVGLFLTREGVLNDFQVVSVTQDAINPDTLNVEVNVLVKFPVNYIKITLVF
tara:strand:+ start:4443 stop:6077 length:1635 start_codon:yes stop_codon:yes gene_type:complete